MQTKDKRHHQDLKPNHFRVSSSSQYSNKLWVQSWQSFCQPSGRISHFHQSISQSAFQHLLPPTLFLSSLSTIWCYLLRQLDIIPSTLPCILSLLHKLLSFSPFTPSLSLSLPLYLSLSPVVCGSMTYCCAECQAVRLQKPVRTHQLLEVRQRIRADFMSPWHQDDDHGSKCVRAGFSVNVCLCALRGHHWFSPVTLTLQQQTGPSKGQGRVSSSCSSTDTVFRHAISGHSW